VVGISSGRYAVIVTNKHDQTEESDAPPKSGWPVGET
jgi:hypothetical protein